MYVRKVRLRNGYKRFHDLTIDLGESPARLVALVGPNGCGKSSVLDGMLFHIRNWGRIGSGLDRDGTYHSMDSDVVLSADAVDIVLSDGPYSEVRQRRAESGTAATIFSFRSPYRYNSALKITQTKASEDIKLNNYGAADASSIDSKMEDNYRRLQGSYGRYIEDKDARPSEAKAKIIGDLNRSIKACLDLEISSLGNVESSRGTLYFKKPGHPKEFEFNVLSSGEKEVVDIILDLYLRREDYTESIFLIDEPELHVNTAIQGKLLKEIDRLVGANCQIWITTHSIGFLRAIQSQMAGRNQIIQFRSDANLASEAAILTPVKPTPAVWRELFAVALDEMADLVSPNVIIYCEGKDKPGAGSSERGLDARVFNNIFGESKPTTMFVSSGGNTELDQRSAIAILIVGKVFPTVDILVLKDRDMASGAETSAQDRALYLENNPKNHRVLSRWEIENYLYDKVVLVHYCAANNLSLDENKYDKAITDIENQPVKDITGIVKSCIGLKGSINPELFKIALSSHVVPGMRVYAQLEGDIFGL